MKLADTNVFWHHGFLYVPIQYTVEPITPSFSRPANHGQLLMLIVAFGAARGTTQIHKCTYIYAFL